MLEVFLSSVQAKVKSKIKNIIGESNTIEKSMSYTSLLPSKMVRAGLIMASGESNTNIHESSLINMACSIEMMHSYSLIHDDLPCMDDDDIRRGSPSNHVVFGEANAVLAGDALQALAFQVISEDEILKDRQKVEAIRLLASACGKNGMVYGQHLDIENENNKYVTQSDLEEIHHLKTGRLIECSILMGQIGSNLDLEDQEKLIKFSRKIGLAFQIKDDVLDIVGSSEKLGKNKLSDVKNDKSTYVKIVGIENAIKRYEALTEEALVLLKNVSHDNGEQNDKLKNLAKYIINRVS